MSNEITTTVKVSVTKNNIKNRGMDASGLKVDQTGVGYASGVMEVTTTPQAIPMGDLTTPGRFVMQSQEDADTGVNIQIGSYDSPGIHEFLELFPVETASGRLKETQPYAKCTTGTAVLEYFILEA